MNIQWKDVNANFNDTNSAMANAREGLSKAGTVFGEIRKSILDEEQRAIENAHRQKVFDESVRQFGLQHALNRDKFAEEQLQHKITNEFNDRKLTLETDYNNRRLAQELRIAQGGWANARQLQQMRIDAENAPRLRKAEAYDNARATYADVFSKTGNVDKALSASEQAFYRKAPDSAFDYRLAVPTESAGLFTPEARATRAAHNDFQAGIALTNIQAGEKALADAENVFNNSDGINYIDPHTGEKRLLSPEEQKSYNSYLTTAGESYRQGILDRINDNRRVLERTGVTQQRAEELSKRIGSGVGEAQIHEDAALRYGTSPEKITPSAVLRDRDIELNKQKAKRERILKEEIEKAEDLKPEAITNSLNKFLSNGIKTTSDSKSTINSIPKNAADRAQEVAELYKELGLGNRAYETYLNLLHQDLIESDNNTFVNTRARSEDYLERVLEEAKGNGKIIPKSFVQPKGVPREVNKLVDNLFKSDPKASSIDIARNQLLVLRELYKKNPSISTYLKGAKNPEEVQQMINRIVEQGSLYGR